jgi:hypothetical protein
VAIGAFGFVEMVLEFLHAKARRRKGRREGVEGWSSRLAFFFAPSRELAGFPLSRE